MSTHLVPAVNGSAGAEPNRQRVPSHNLSLARGGHTAGKKMVPRRRLGQPVGGFLLGPLGNNSHNPTHQARPTMSPLKRDLGGWHAELRARARTPKAPLPGGPRAFEAGEDGSSSENPGDDDGSEFSDPGASESEEDPSRTSTRPPSYQPRARGLMQAAREINGSGDTLVGQLSRLQLDPPHETAARSEGVKATSRPVTPPPSVDRGKPPGLVSPTKPPRIPSTPHRPEVDIFWNQEFVDDWNTEHSPRKPPRPNKAADLLIPGDSPKKTAAALREAKKTFASKKHSIAEEFLAELDRLVTGNQLGELAASTGGIRITWSNRLNTTAGRASWRRETLRLGTNSTAGGAELHRHHASIELAEKVIDDESRLLNVVAHEFCHLANFMISGVTTNPHGKEFKAWAARCSRAFGHRGIKVTTKHSYTIDFKYIWQCAQCATEFKRHSKSVDVQKHRCGACKGQLAQIKPRPRAPGAKSEYQKFVQAEMKSVKQEHPKSPQKELMKLVAERWKTTRDEAGVEPAAISTPETEDISKLLVDLTLESAD